MESGARVRTDSKNILEIVRSYKGFIGDLSGSWEGPSYDKFNGEAESFIGECSSITSGMDSFATACETYSKYLEQKEMLKEIESALAIARKNNETNTVLYELGQKTTCEANIIALEALIKSSLDSACKSTITEATAVTISAGEVPDIKIKPSSTNVFPELVGGEAGELPNARLGADGKPLKQGYYDEANNIYDLNYRGQDKEGGNCTYYTWARASELIGKPLISGDKQWGNAGTWYSNCKEYNKGQTPKLGAIAVWKGGGQGWGHVAVVEKIDSDGTIHTSEGSYNMGVWYKNGKYSKSNNYGFGGYKLQGFIYPNEAKNT